MTNNNRNINNIFYIFVTAHLIFWTLVPSITNQNLPLDTIEALAWGSNLDWGFNKHPPMSAFFQKFSFKFLDLKIGYIICSVKFLCLFLSIMYLNCLKKYLITIYLD